MTGADLALLVAGLLVAGFSKGATALGLPLIATPLLASVFGPRDAVAIVAVPILATNTILLLQDWRHLRALSGLRAFLVLNAIGAAVGTQLVAHIDQRAFAVLIAGVVGLFLLRGDRAAGHRALGPLVGLIGGLLQGTTSISGPVIGSYFHALRLAPREYVLTLALVFELNAFTQIAGYAAAGIYTPALLGLGAAGCLPAIAGLFAGVALRGRLDPRTTRRLIVILLISSVAGLLWRTFIS